MATSNKPCPSNKSQPFSESTFMKPYRVGVLGGMGPLAGIELHRLIIEATPAQIDQDHLQVVLFTDPKIPDRSTSLIRDGGRSFAAAAAKSAQVLEQAGVDIISLACMTAHSRLAVIQAAVGVPVLNGIELTQELLDRDYAGKRIALLATTGSIKAEIYTAGSRTIDWLLPEPAAQSRIMAGIYDIKAGHFEHGADKITDTLGELTARGASVFVLGCTEIGLLQGRLTDLGYEVVDPMRVLASKVVELSQF